MSNEQEGQVVEVLPGNLYRVQFSDDRLLICYLSGKMKINHISLVIGDKVLVILDPYGGKTTNRIIRRR